MLPAPFQREGAILPTRIPLHFERFYRATLRRVVGSRIRSVELRDAYMAWAAANGAPSMSFVELRRAVEGIGHRRIQSNGVRYADLIMAVDVPELADTLPALVSGVAGAGRTADQTDMVARVDAALASLLDLRRSLVASSDRQAPAEAAQRILGLFDPA